MSTETRDRTDRIQELLDRTRRIETRFTRYLEDQGFDTKTRQPVWREGTVTVPSVSCAMQDILNAIPADWPDTAPVQVRHQEHVLCTLTGPKRK